MVGRTRQDRGEKFYPPDKIEEIKKGDINHGKRNRKEREHGTDLQ